MKDVLRHIDDQVVRVLVNSLIHRDTFCFAGYLARVDMRDLLETALRNKIEYVLFHISDCRNCRAHAGSEILAELKQIRFRTRYALLHRASELRTLEKLLASKIGALALKELDPQGVIGETDFRHTGTDLDILLRPEDMEKLVSMYVRHGYRRTADTVPKETVIVNPRTGFEIDIHSMVAYPHYGGLTPVEDARIRRISGDMVGLATHSGGLRYLDPARYFFIQIIRYWYNDMLCGLNGLYQIGSFPGRNSNRINWRIFHELTDKYALAGEVSFVLSLAGMVFGFGIPEELRRYTPLSTGIFASLYSPSEIARFPYIKKWDIPRYHGVVARRYRKFFLVKLLVNGDTPRLRLLRPRLLLLAIQALVRYILWRITYVSSVSF